MKKQKILKQTITNKKHGFTIVELLTVMSVIMILIGLLVPALNQVKRYAKQVRQRAQFHSIDVAMELFQTENEGYPPSGPDGADGRPYCGAMKLAEAMVGQDLLGFHPDSTFRSDYENANGDLLYQIPGGPDIDESNRNSRLGPYLQLENANATRIEDIYGTGNCGNFNEYTYVLCDVYRRTMANENATKTGMPILYYKADPSGTINPCERNSYTENSNGRIYKHEDNDELVELGIPWTYDNDEHPLYSNYSGTEEGLPESFYYRINNDDIPIDAGRPYRADSYILLSAGYDGKYGTADDIYNFERR